MRTDMFTKALLVILAGGVWCLALTHGTDRVNAKAPAVPNVIRAHKFELINSKGKVDVILVPNSDNSKGGAPGVTVCDAKGNRRAAIIITELGPILFLCDANGMGRASLLVSKFGPMLSLYDANGIAMASLDVDKDGSVLYLKDSKGNTRAELGVLPDGPYLDLNDAKGNTRAELGVPSYGPCLDLNDENGNTRGEFGVEYTVDKATGAITRSPTITLYDAKGNVLYQKP